MGAPRSVTPSTTNPPIPESHDSSSTAMMRLSTDYGWMDRKFLFMHAPADDDRMTSAPAATAGVDDMLHARRLERRVQERLDALPETQRTAYQLVKNRRPGPRSVTRTTT
jgi:hypothetical protein